MPNTLYAPCSWRVALELQAPPPQGNLLTAYYTRSIMPDYISTYFLTVSRIENRYEEIITNHVLFSKYPYNSSDRDDEDWCFLSMRSKETADWKRFGLLQRLDRIMDLMFQEWVENYA